jgi:hypothetical protein
MERRPGARPDGGPTVSDDAPAGVGPRFVRSARFWLRAYPRRWRAARGEEVLGLLADLAHPGARRIGTRAALDLLRGGLATRWREHPPLGPWLLYRLFDRRLPAHRAWVLDDVNGPWLVLRRNTSFATLLLAYGTARRDTFLMVFAATMITLGLTLLRRRTRERAIELHLVPRPGEPLLPGAFLRVAVPRRRVTARSGLPWAVGCLTVLAAVGVVAAIHAPLGLDLTVGPLPGEPATLLTADTVLVLVGDRTPVLVAVGLALVVGLTLVPVARRRLRRCLTVEVDQPDRALGRQTWRGRGAVVLVTGLVAAVPVSEAFGVTPLSVSLLVGVPALVLLPTALATWAALRRAPVADRLAYVDAQRIVLRGRPPRVDAPASGLKPVRGVLPGAVAPTRRLLDPPYPALPT